MTDKKTYLSAPQREIFTGGVTSCRDLAFYKMKEGRRISVTDSKATDKKDVCDRAIRSIASGDGEALSVIYDAYGKLIYSTALLITRDSGEAEDVLQNVMLKPLTFSEHYKSGSDPKAWIMAITKNCCIDVIRKRPPTTDVEEIAEPYEDKEDEIVERMSVREALGALCETDRNIVKLKIYSGYSHYEIADLLGMSAANVRKRYERALKKLGKILG